MCISMHSSAIRRVVLFICILKSPLNQSFLLATFRFNLIDSLVRFLNSTHVNSSHPFDTVFSWWDPKLAKNVASCDVPIVVSCNSFAYTQLQCFLHDEYRFWKSGSDDAVERLSRVLGATMQTSTEIRIGEV